MKKEIRNMTDLTNAKALLEKIEGGSCGYKTSLPDFDMPIGGLPSCSFFDCNVPMYGAITKPGWRIKE